MKNGYLLIRGAIATLAVVMLAGCERKTPQTAGGEVAGAEFDRTQLAAFAPVPDLMAPAPMPQSRVALGRALYYETVLSDGHDLSCNGCHPLNGYGADGRAVSMGHKGQLGSRNAPTVYHAAGQIAQFWDGRAADVEAQAVGPILNPAEMGMPDSAAVLAHLRGDARYRAMFVEAFPDDAQPVTYANVGRAIGAFERGLVTPAPWDAFLRGDSTALGAKQKQGFATFTSLGCQACHNGPYVGGASLQKLGVKAPWPSQADSGRYLVTKKPADIMVFKVPTLRNVTMTAPYFHDGSVASLPDAVRMMGRYQLGKELTDAQVNSIVDWLGSLKGEIPVDYVAQPPLPSDNH